MTPVVALVMCCLCTFLCCVLARDWRHVLAWRKLKTMTVKPQSANTASESGFLPRSCLRQDSKQWVSVSAQRPLQFHSHPCMRPLEFLIHSCVTFLSPPPLPPFPRPLCAGAKQSNGCWHILEPCCPTHSLSLMCRPSRWLSAPQLGSGRDKRTKAISPATNNRFQSCTFVPFRSLIGGVIYIRKGRTHPISGF